MNRTGTFQLQLKGKNHCGRKTHYVGNGLSLHSPNGTSVAYEVELVCGERLDARGFLVDQLSIDAYFQKIGSTTLSCEKLCHKCAKDVVALVRQENPQAEVHCVRLTLSPFPHEASMRFESMSPNYTKALGRRA